MGNRAVITTPANWENCGVGIYVHWNGGRDSVEAFLKYCELKGYRSPDKDNYGWARLCQVIGNFFGGSTSVGIDTLWHLDRDNGDNGVYLIENWKIVGRRYFDYNEERGYNLNEFLLAIDEAMPEKERITKFLNGKEVPIDEITVGTEIVYIDWNGEIKESKVVGIGEKGKRVNGNDVEGVPYINMFKQGEPGENPNNYLSELNYRVKEVSE